MRKLLLVFSLAAILSGCGNPEAEIQPRVESMLTVIDRAGVEKKIPSSQFIDAETGRPTVEKVLVIDQQAKKKGFIDATELQSQSPSTPRYFPVTEEIASEG